MDKYLLFRLIFSRWEIIQWINIYIFTYKGLHEVLPGIICNFLMFYPIISLI